MPDKTAKRQMTLSTLGGLAASAGIKFLYGHAAALLKARRERRGRAAADEEPPAQLTMPIVATEVLAMAPAEPVVDAAVPDQEHASLVTLRTGPLVR